MSIAVRNIGKKFGSFVALENISLEFPTGKLVALLGPSGCGKTTLLRIIAGLEYADRGEVILDGEDASDRHVRERQVGFVFQHYALFRHMTIFENVAFGLRVKPRSQRPPEREIRRKVMELLELVQLGWVADRYPAQLSGGQRQRIALARALAVGPRVLLLDEPFGALDAKVRKELRRWLRSLHDELHITSIFVTHDQDEAIELADQLVVMHKGKVEQTGSPHEVYAAPATPFVYGFLGAVNEFRGSVDGNYLRVGGNALPIVGGDVAKGQAAVAFARPHELEIIADRVDGEAGIGATIKRIVDVGSVARVELSGAAPDQPHLYEVELPSQRLAELNLAAGQSVRLVSSRLRVFAQGDSP